MIVPSSVFLHYLKRLDRLLKRIERFQPDISGNRLHPDMFPLLQQARTAISFALRACCPLAGREIVSFGDGEYNYENIYAELAAAIQYLAAIPPEEYGDLGARTIDTAAGFADLRMNGWDYYLTYCLPNFCFHYSMVYAIARQAGVPIGKADYDGFHKYPLGFSFTDECDPEDLPQRA
ncbi:hypothetical protein IP92_03258 [Pseudoduganella flava]|uniref:DUF1993 family protein n=1 Tax=Pseudoduganella flava TaxID=871742 RepID=A0A562PN88_9BURK|nr:DUF1993 domain-containing protein [Pseudoduganella flava]QGZ40394.1 DUF1993 family protein [Pseudoduganella flava]TWI45828.1 hypothetical protein IP92_03258 [Pseudoduganella flava]